MRAQTSAIARDSPGTLTILPQGHPTLVLLFMTLKVVSLAFLVSLSLTSWSRWAHSETIAIWTKRRGSATSFLCVQMETPPFLDEFLLLFEEN